MTTEDQTIPPRPAESYCPMERRDIQLSDDAIRLIAQNVHIAVAEGIESGVSRAVTPELAERLWSVFFVMLRQRAQEQAGGLLLGWLKSIVKTAVLAALLLLVAAKLGGWPLMVKVWDLTVTRP